MIKHFYISNAQYQDQLANPGTVLIKCIEWFRQLEEYGDSELVSIDIERKYEYLEGISYSAHVVYEVGVNG